MKDRFGQTVPIQITLLLEEQSDLGSQCLHFCVNLFREIPYDKAILFVITVMILSFRTDWSGQIVQTQIRLLLEEQSDQGLHCLQYCLHLLDALLYGKTSFFPVLG